MSRIRVRIPLVQKIAGYIRSVRCAKIVPGFNPSTRSGLPLSEEQIPRFVGNSGSWN